MQEINHYIDGKGWKEENAQYQKIFQPATGKVTKQVALGGDVAMSQAVASCKNAFLGWSNTNPQRRARILFKFRELVSNEIEQLAYLLSDEHGKILADSIGDIQRGLDVIEFACGIPHLQKGEYTQNAGSGIDVFSIKQAIGIGAGITPFNFPAMIPMWMFGVAIACGNCFILKPSERDPSLPLRLAELMTEAGLPDGVLNVVNGGKDAVDAIISNQEIKAISFVGSSAIAEYIYAGGTKNGKRVQAFGGAKNHMIIMPDADMDMVTNQLLGSAFGSAGERCMATPVVVPVGDKTHKNLLACLLPKIDKLVIGSSFDKKADYGPVVTSEHWQKIVAWINISEKEGATILRDGRNFKLKGYEDGYYLGPTLIDNVTTNMQSYHQEIFGPVLQIVKADNFDEAVKLPSEHQYGNGVSIFTNNGTAAREFVARVNVGMVGVNVPIPVPVSYHSFGGWKKSVFGDINQHGTAGVNFWTKTKTVTQRWPDEVLDAEFTIPLMK